MFEKIYIYIYIYCFNMKYTDILFAESFDYQVRTMLDWYSCDRKISKLELHETSLTTSLVAYQNCTLSIPSHHLYTSRDIEEPTFIAINYVCEFLPGQNSSESENSVDVFGSNGDRELVLLGVWWRKVVAGRDVRNLELFTERSQDGVWCFVGGSAEHARYSGSTQLRTHCNREWFESRVVTR